MELTKKELSFLLKITNKKIRKWPKFVCFYVGIFLVILPLIILPLFQDRHYIYNMPEERYFAILHARAFVFWFGVLFLFLSKYFNMKIILGKLYTHIQQLEGKSSEEK